MNATFTESLVPPATVAGFATARSPLRRTDATTDLYHFAIATFDCDADRLASLLPRGLVPERRRLDDGRERAFVSAVSFWVVDFRFLGAAAVCVSFPQANYRAYVLDAAGRRAVYFFETTLDTRLSVLPRRLWGMPWREGRTSIDADWRGGRCHGYRHVCTGADNAADASFAGTDDAPGRLDGFADAEDAAVVLTHPLLGYFRRPDGGLGRYSVWHERLTLTIGVARAARYQVFERLGLVEPGAVPHSVLLQRVVPFDVHLPPVVVTRGGQAEPG